MTVAKMPLSYPPSSAPLFGGETEAKSGALTWMILSQFYRPVQYFLTILHSCFHCTNEKKRFYKLFCQNWRKQCIIENTKISVFRLLPCLKVPVMWSSLRIVINYHTMQWYLGQSRRHTLSESNLLKHCLEYINKKSKSHMLQLESFWIL